MVKVEIGSGRHRGQGEGMQRQMGAWKGRAQRRGWVSKESETRLQTDTTAPKKSDQDREDQGKQESQRGQIPERKAEMQRPVKARLAKRKRNQLNRLRLHQSGQSHPEGQCRKPHFTDPLSPGAYLNPISLFNSITANIICSIVFGVRINYQDPRFLWLLNLLNEIFTIISSFYSQVNLWIPWWPGIRVGGPQEGFRCFLSWTAKQEASERLVFCAHTSLPAPCQVRRWVRMEVAMGLLQEWIWEEISADVRVTGTGCSCSCTTEGVNVRIWVWSARRLTPQILGWMAPFRCCCMLCTTSTPIVCAQRLEQVLGPFLLSSRC